MHRIPSFVLVLFVALVSAPLACVADDSATVDGFVAREYQSATEVKLPYRLFSPRSTKRDQELAPQIPDTSTWHSTSDNPSPHVAALLELLAELRSELHIRAFKEPDLPGWMLRSDGPDNSVLRSMRMLCIVPLILGVTQACAAADNAPANATAFVHVTVVPMDRERVLRNWTVIIADGRIRELGPISAISVPKRATVIDGHGKYLMPGLADMHAHTWEEDDFPLLLANGVTTVRNMFGGPIHLRWKERIAAGEFDGPMIYTAGPIIDGNPPIWPGAVVTTAEEARRTVAEQHAAGHDFLKVYSRLSREAYDAINREGKALGMKVTGHVPDAVGLSAALRSGIDSIEHLSGYESLARKEPMGAGEEASWARLDESRFEAVSHETAQSGAWNCPTLVLFQHRVAPGESEYLGRLLARDEMRYVSAETVRSWLPQNNFLKSSTPARAASSRGKGDTMRKKLVKALHRSGARLLLGTDYGNPFVLPGFSLHQELRNFADAGLSPFEAIRAGTSGAAEFMNAQDEFGTVAVGARADLILIEGNPLEDVANVNKLAGVMVRGKWYSQRQLLGELEKLAARFQSESQ